MGISFHRVQNYVNLWVFLSTKLLIFVYIASKYICHKNISFSRKIWQISFLSIWQKVWQVNRSAKNLLIVTSNLDGFSLVNHGGFAKLSRYIVNILAFHIMKI